MTFLPPEDQERCERVGIPKNKCKKCGYRWYAGMGIHDFQRDQFIVVCPKCGASRPIAMILTREDGTPVKLWGKPSDLKP